MNLILIYNGNANLRPFLPTTFYIPLPWDEICLVILNIVFRILSAKIQCSNTHSPRFYVL